MKTIQFSIDVELAEEYCRKYREAYPDSDASNLDDQALLETAIHDRLVEEIDFLVNEPR